jgi:hypothetical protein
MRLDDVDQSMRGHNKRKRVIHNFGYDFGRAWNPIHKKVGDRRDLLLVNLNSHLPDTSTAASHSTMRWQLFPTPSTSYPSSGGSAGAGTIDEHAPSSSTSHTSSTSHPVPTLNRYETTLRDEERYQDAQYPTFKDLPGCMQLL